MSQNRCEEDDDDELLAEGVALSEAEAGKGPGKLRWSPRPRDMLYWFDRNPREVEYSTRNPYGTLPSRLLDSVLCCKNSGVSQHMLYNSVALW